MCYRGCQLSGETDKTRAPFFYGLLAAATSEPGDSASRGVLSCRKWVEICIHHVENFIQTFPINPSIFGREYGVYGIWGV